MTLFGLQIACSCSDHPIGMDVVDNHIWDGEDEGGFVKGRRYVWRCPECGHIICVNMKEMDE